LLCERGVRGKVNRLQHKSSRLVDNIEVAGAIGHVGLDVQAVR